MIHPDKLIKFAVYGGDEDFLGVVDVTLPNLTPLKETSKGAGILGEYETGTPGQYGSLKLQMTWRVATKQAAKLAHPDGMALTLKGVTQGIDSGTYKPTKTPVTVTVRPFASDLQLGKFDPATAMGTTTEVECLYIKYTIDGEIIYEVDKLNDKCIINGEDVMSEINTMLGR